MAAITASACGPQRVVLPVGAGVPRVDGVAIFEAATRSCRDIHSLTADLGLSGTAGQQKLRGHVIAGFSAGSLRLEGVAPFGGPVFILAAENDRGTLLLTRDRRVVRSAPPADILQALVGVRLSPDDLLAVLTGCVKAAPVPVSARAYGVDWIAVDLRGGATGYLRRTGADWLVVAGMLEGLQVEYGNNAGVLPDQVRVHSADPRQQPKVDLQLRLQSFTTNPDIDRAAFSVIVPADAQPISLDELRTAGPLGQ